MATPIHDPDLLNSLIPGSLNKKNPNTPVSLSLIPNEDPMSYNDLQALLANMLQKLLTTMSQSIQLILEQQKNNAVIANFGIAVANKGLEEAKTAETKLEEQEYEIQHPPWWKILLACICPIIGITLIVQPMISLDQANGIKSPGLEFVSAIFKYVLPIVMIVVSSIFLGPEAAVVAAALFIATTIPIKDGKSMLELGEDAAIHAIAVNSGLNEDQEKIFSACMKIVMAIVIIVVCSAVGNAAGGEGGAEEAAGSVGEEVGGEVEGETQSLQDTALNTQENSTTLSELTTETKIEEVATNTKIKEARFQYKKMTSRACGWNAASSTLGNNSAIEDLVYGSIRCANPNTTKEEAKRKAQMVAMALNLVLSVALMVGRGVSLSNMNQSSQTVRLFNQGLTKALPQIMKALNLAMLTAGAAQAANSIQLAFQAKDLAAFRAGLIKLEGLLTWSGGMQQQINNADQMLATAQKSVQDTYATTLANPQNAKPLFTEASEIQNGQKA